jgi:hypothetical protein
MADGVRHRKDCEAERECHAEQANAARLHARGQHGGTTAAENEDERAESFGHQFALHEHPPRLMLFAAQ